MPKNQATTTTLQDDLLKLGFDTSEIMMICSKDQAYNYIYAILEYYKYMSLKPGMQMFAFDPKTIISILNVGIDRVFLFLKNIDQLQPLIVSGKVSISSIKHILTHSQQHRSKSDLQKLIKSHQTPYTKESSLAYTYTVNDAKSIKAKPSARMVQTTQPLMTQAESLSFLQFTMNEDFEKIYESEIQKNGSIFFFKDIQIKVYRDELIESIVHDIKDALANMPSTQTHKELLPQVLTRQDRVTICSYTDGAYTLYLLDDSNQQCAYFCKLTKKHFSADEIISIAKT